ncbi:Torsin [Aphelenchoides bicaudatus]|nr:Torsin [Aphelenchoides bicaudatus]
MNSKRVFCLILLLLISSQVQAELITLTAAGGLFASGVAVFKYVADSAVAPLHYGSDLVYSGFNYLKCHMFECCGEPWIQKGVSNSLREQMNNDLYGQHIAKDIILRSIHAHMEKQNPKKALVLSLHGWTGSGKNYLASMVRRAMYKKDDHSNFAHLFVSTLHFPHPDEVPKYQSQIRSWIYGNISNCERSLFIFDEIDKLPIQLMDAVRPFIDFYERIDTVDPRKSVFLFLSNAAGNTIAKQSLDHYNAGLPREQLTHKEMEEIIKLSAYNEGEGGLKKSELLNRHLIDAFVPFLPLERKHVRMCITDYMKSRGYKITDERVDAIINELTFFPKENPIFSLSGCKPIAQKVDLFYAHELDAFTFHDAHDDL